MQRKVMWRSGMLEFVDESVEDVVAEFNRYNRTRLKVEDPAIGCRRIGGRFLISDIDGFVATLGRVVDMRVETSQESSGAVVHLDPVRRPLPIVDTQVPK
jgi:transmembrane sensor